MLALLKKGGCHTMKPQVVVWSEKMQMATAIDILGRSKDHKKVYIIELKYCSHSTEATRRCYKLSHPGTHRMKGLQLLNSLYNHHQMQIRATVRLFKANYPLPKGTEIIAGVVVACGDGGMLFYHMR